MTQSDTVANERARPNWLGRARWAVGRAGIAIPFVVVFLLLAVVSPPFLRFQNLTNILDQQSGIIIVAAAGTLVLIAGGIDLSVGATYGLAGATAAQLAATYGPPVGILAALGVGLVTGIANGVVVTRFRINPLIGTLAMSFVVSGIAAIAVALLIAMDLPGSAIWALGLLVGINLLFSGWSYVFLALAGRRAQQASAA